MNERIIQFGTTGSLIGIVTRPNDDSIDPSKPAVILLNSGIVHKVGPHRLYVKLARAFANNGFCFRAMIGAIAYQDNGFAAGPNGTVGAGWVF